MAKILIIDDELKLRETIRELLSFTGYDVIEAQNGQEGLQKVKEFLPDLIMCDVMMPVLDGYGFLEAHLLSDCSHIPVIFATAKVPYSHQEKAFALGVKGYFRKPFIFKELLQTISQYVDL